ncbi:MAG TPA: histidinol-phosphate transaminase [Oscillatoriaceae cyanobacterium]
MSKLDKLQRLDLLGLVPQNQVTPLVHLKLDEDEGDRDWPDSLKAFYNEQLARADWQRYPPGQTDLKRAIAEPLGLTHEWVSLGAGADEVLRHLLMAWALRGTVIYPVPTNALYGLTAQCLGIKHVAVMLNADFTLPVEQVIATARLQEASVILIGNPNNPTGNLFSRDELLTIVRETACLVVVDESFIDYSGLTLADVLEEHDNLALLRSFSHAWCAAAFRLGYLLGSPRVVAELEKVRSPHNVSAAALLAGQVMLARPAAFRDHWQGAVHAREALRAALSGVRDVVSWPSAANFLLVGTTLNGEELAERLLTRGIAVRPFSRSPLMNCIRVTVGRPEENAEFVAAMTAIFGPAA